MNRNVQQCRECSRLFESAFGEKTCPECLDKLDKQYDIIKKYVYEHPESNIMKTSLDTGIPVKTVIYFLKDGRLTINDSSGMFACEGCGKPITTGKYCSDCLINIEKDLNSVISAEMVEEEKSVEVPRNNGGMHSEFDKRKI